MIAPKTLGSIIASARPTREIAIALIRSYGADVARLDAKEQFLLQQSNYFQHCAEIQACSDKSRIASREIDRLMERFGIAEGEIAET